MEDFSFWMEMGYSHILDWQGYDHMLFLLALCCVYTLGDKRWIWLVSAFTIGHAISLALSVLGFVRLPSSLIEAMIPATIAFSCVQHLWPLVNRGKQVLTQSSILPTVLVFGLIHGLGFSNFLRSMLGSETSIAFPLFSFHVGLELGQILIILAVLSITTLMDRYLHIEQPKRIALLATPVLLVSLWMLINRLPLQ
ncbi:MAG: HupE/UreJ family protein [Bacteroidota bacterium]